MPYLTKDIKDKLDKNAMSATTAGMLNYQLTKVCLEYLMFNDESYATYNDIMGALEGCKSEFYRRKIAPYEDKKRNENGDVFNNNF